MRTITLTNDFHGTEARVIPRLIAEGRWAGFYRISRRTALRLRATLCGAHEYCCSGTFGDRGGVRLELVNEDYDRSYIVDMGED